MSVLTQQVFAAPGQVFSTISGGGGGGGGVGNTLTLSTLTFGVGVDANSNNILAGTGIVQIAAVGDGTNNSLQLGSFGSANPFPGNQYGLSLNGSQGDITFGDSIGTNGALTLINYQASGLVSGNISTFIYGNTEIKPDGTGGGSRLTVDALNCSSINGAAPGGGGGSIPGNLSVSSLTLQGSPTAAGGVFNVQATDTDLYTFSVSSATTYADFNLGIVGGRQQVYADTLEAPNFYTSTIKGATGQISLNPDGVNQIQIGGTGAPGDIFITTTGGGLIKMAGSVVMSNALSAPTGSFSSITLNNNGQAIQTATSTIGFANVATSGNQIVFEFTTATGAAMGMIAQNASDGISLVVDNGLAYMSFGGGHGALSNVSSINGAAPALTSGTTNDVAALFSSLFAANPSLSTIAL